MQIKSRRGLGIRTLVLAGATAAALLATAGSASATSVNFYYPHILGLESSIGNPVKAEVTLLNGKLRFKRTDGQSIVGGKWDGKCKQPSPGEVVCNAAGVMFVTFAGSSGNDTFINKSGLQSSMSGERGDDHLIGGANNDTINGDAGYDTIEGHKGNDTLTGSSQPDSIVGNKGNDTINTSFQDYGTRDTTIECGEGDDTLTYSVSDWRSGLMTCEHRTQVG